MCCVWIFTTAKSWQRFLDCKRQKAARQAPRDVLSAHSCPTMAEWARLGVRNPAFRLTVRAQLLPGSSAWTEREGEPLGHDRGLQHPLDGQVLAPCHSSFNHPERVATLPPSYS